MWRYIAGYSQGGQGDPGKILEQIRQDLLQNFTREQPPALGVHPPVLVPGQLPRSDQPVRDQSQLLREDPAGRLQHVSSKHLFLVV